MEDKKFTKHALSIDQRENIKISGVLDVISFDEEMVVSQTDLGILILKGNNLHINQLNLNRGELELDGYITSLNYEDKDSFGCSKGSFLNKIFK